MLSSAAVERTTARNANTQDSAAPALTAVHLKKARQKAEKDAAQEARIQQLIEDTNVKIGGRVNECATPEENGRLLDAFVAEIYKEDTKKDWPMLDKGIKFIEAMKKCPFRLLYTDEEDEEQYEEDLTHKHTGGTTRKLAEQLRPRKRSRKPEQPEQSAQPASLAMGEAAKVYQTMAQASQPNGNKEEEKTAAAPVSTCTTVDAPSSLDESRPMKKRRIDNLESNLGKKWDARVDEFGRRSTRSTTQKQ
ncbi:hypothetical protein GGR53DRAFT_486037 [Hypoxylon sp. FL1150]|nr:hypothetical protein GGR53DRAFT_486037 [Hypoxylon sp. FL1150]